MIPANTASQTFDLGQGDRYRPPVLSTSSTVMSSGHEHAATFTQGDNQDAVQDRESSDLPRPTGSDILGALAPGRLEASFVLGSPTGPSQNASAAPGNTFQYRNPHRGGGERGGFPSAFLSAGLDNSQQSSVLGSSLDVSLAGPGFYRPRRTVDSSIVRDSRGPGTRGAVGNNQLDVPSVLRSVLKGEDIDFENDFYWLMKVS